MTLPDSHHALFLHLEGARCGACSAIPPSPALCLSCGELLCLGAGATCRGPAPGPLGTQPGAVATHATACGAGSALFFLPRATRLLGVASGVGTLLPAPYLDAHGEEDPGLRRGRPLTLCGLRVQGPAASVVAGGGGVGV